MKHIVFNPFSLLLYSLFSLVAQEELPESALHKAARLNYYKEIPHLITDDILNEQDTKGNTPLHVAIKFRSTKAAELLAQQPKVDVNILNKTGYAPLHFAIIFPQPTVVKCLLNAKANPSLPSTPSSASPLHMAASASQLEIIKMLIGAGANLNQQDIRERSPLYYAKNRDIFCLLIAEGAYTQEASGRIDLWYAKCFEVPLQLFILAGHDEIRCPHVMTLNEQDEFGATALMYLAAQGKIDDVRKQLDQGANLLTTDTYGRNVFRILTTILKNKDDLILSEEKQQCYNAIMLLCYKRLAKIVWCIHKKPNTQLSKLPLDLVKLFMFIVTGMIIPDKI
jgi:hypothetical protein